MVKKLFKSQKPALFLTIGTAVTLISGGAIAWWILQQRPNLTGLQAGADVLPQDTVLAMSFTTDKRQWRQLRRFGTSETQKVFDQYLAGWRDRLLTANGLTYQRDIEPWVGGEITVAFLSPLAAGASPNSSTPQIQPYTPENAALPAPMVIVVPIADPLKAQQLLGKSAAGQEAVERDYQGHSIREVHGKAALSYAATVIENRLIAISTDARAIERVIDAFKSRKSIAGAAGYSQALNQLINPAAFMRSYVNVPAAEVLTTNNMAQPVPPQALFFARGSQGVAATTTLEAEGMRIKGLTWLPSNMSHRYRVENKAERMPSLFPNSAILLVSGGNLRSLWQDFNQLAGKNPSPRLWGPNTIQNGVTNFTGLNLEKDLMPWMAGEYGLALISAPATAANSEGAAGLLLMLQVSDRRAADEGFKKLETTLRDRYRFQVSETEVGGQPLVNWVSPEGSARAARGWLEGNVAYVAIGPGVPKLVPPVTGQSIGEDSEFVKTNSPDLNPNNGRFFIEMAALVNSVESNPLLPKFPPQSKAFLSAIRSIGVTSAVQDGRTFQFDTQLLLRKTEQTPGALPAPQSPSSSPSPQPSASP